MGTTFNRLIQGGLICPKGYIPFLRLEVLYIKRMGFHGLNCFKGPIKIYGTVQQKRYAVFFMVGLCKGYHFLWKVYNYVCDERASFSCKNVI